MPEVLKSKNAQRAMAKRATLEMFQSKKPRSEELEFKLGGEEVSIRLVSIGRLEYDKLITKCPPTVTQRAAGATYDQEKFAPILLSRVVKEPEFAEADWRLIWNDENWNRAELGDLFFKAVDVCSSGLDVNPTESG